MELLNTALNYNNHNLTVMPLPSGSKQPFKGSRWKLDYCSRPQTSLQVAELFLESKDNIAIICGDVSKNFYCLDFDSMALFDKHRIEIEKILNSTAVVKTSRGVHVYLKSPSPVKTSAQGKLDIRGNGSYIVAPPSLHPGGHQYTFWDTFETILELDPAELPFSIESPRPTNNSAPQPQTGLLNIRLYGIPYKLTMILYAAPEAFQRYESRSEADQALITYLALNRWSLEEVSSLYSKHALPGTKYIEKGKHAEKYLLKNYQSAQNYLQENKREIDRTIDHIENASPYLFNGRTAHVDQAVFNAIITIARRTGKVDDIGASCREIAELSGITQMTANRALNRIEYLAKVMKDEFTATTYYNINTEKIEKLSKSYIPSHSVNTDITPKSYIPSHCFTIGSIRGIEKADIFRTRGLGKNGAKLYSFLLHHKEYIKIGEILGVSGLKMGRRTLDRKIGLFLFCKMIEKDGHQVRAVPGADLDAAARLLGTAGAADKQRAQHKREREGYQEYKEKRRVEDKT